MSMQDPRVDGVRRYRTHGWSEQVGGGAGHTGGGSEYRCRARGWREWVGSDTGPIGGGIG